MRVCFCSQHIIAYAGGQEARRKYTFGNTWKFLRMPVKPFFLHERTCLFLREILAVYHSTSLALVPTVNPTLCIVSTAITLSTPQSGLSSSGALCHLEGQLTARSPGTRGNRAPIARLAHIASDKQRTNFVKPFRVPYIENKFCQLKYNYECSFI